MYITHITVQYHLLIFDEGVGHDNFIATSRGKVFESRQVFGCPRQSSQIVMKFNRFVGMFAFLVIWKTTGTD
jgi:hypothetical protein